MSKKKESGPFDREGHASVAEVCSYLGLSSQAVYNLLYAGEIPYARFGGTIRVQRSDVVEYVKRQFEEAKNATV